MFGLEWLELDIMESKHAQIQEWRSRGYQWSVTYKQDSHVYHGLADSNLDFSDAKELLSGAAVLAHKQEMVGSTALVLMAISEDFCAICGFIDGRIVLDTVSALAELSSVRTSFVQKLSSQGHESAYTVFGTPGLAQGDEQIIQWDDLYIAQVKRKFSTYKIRPFKSERSDLITLAVLVVCLLAGIGGWFWSRQAKAHKLEILAAGEAQNSPHAKYQRYVDQLLNGKDEFTSAQAGIDAVNKAIEGLPVNVGDWILVDIVCQFKTPQCKIKYKRAASTVSTVESTYKSFFDSFGEKLPSYFNPKTWESMRSNATLNGPIIEVIAPLSPKRTATPAREQWPGYKEFLMVHGSRYQSLEVLGFAISLSEPIVQSDVIPQSVAQALPEAIYALTWSISNKPWWMHEALTQGANTMDIRVVRLVRVEAGINFFAEGIVYVSKVN